MSEIAHGTTGGYVNWHCRCDECSAAQRGKFRQQRERRLDRMREGSPDVPHGTVSGYTAWGCRCGACKSARAEWMASRKATR